MPKKIVFKKSYTRDSTLIIQEVWSLGVAKNNPHQPPVIININDGLIEVWENVASVKWLQQKKYKNLLEIITAYSKLLNIIKTNWEEKYFTTAAQLIDYIQLCYKAIPYFVQIYYSADNTEINKALREKCFSLRSKDVFFSESIRLIRQTLIHLYPQLKGFEQLITTTELKNDKLPTLQVLKQRARHYIMIYDYYYQIINLKKFAQDHAKYTFAFDKINAATNVLQGKTAHLGIVKGRVRIINRFSEINKIKKGEILVSEMTTPEMVPAIKKAAAIVTNEGGITCHAAIISRELNKPCIIGTKIATQALKDGDKVEVDADHGIIRIIK